MKQGNRTNSTASASAAPHHGAGLRAKRVLAMAVVAVGATFGAAAFAQQGDAGPRAPGMRGMGGPAMGGPGFLMGRPERLERMLDAVGATDAQRAQIREIAAAAAADLRTQHEAARDLRERGLQLLAARTIDRAAAESLRLSALAQHDQASKRMLQAMLDTADVLTPEQRAKLVEIMKRRGERMRQHRMSPPQGASGNR
jgi:protein CpxP